MTRIATDLALSPDGDLIIKDNDIGVASGSDYQIQSAINRIKSVMNDWRLDHIGADMEDLIGKPNTTETAQEGIEKITNALVMDGLFRKEDIYVKPAPASKTQLYFFVFIKSEFLSDPVGLVVMLDLVSGSIVLEEV